ncbi:uncharacterized protein PHACADRAFT_60339, partial [Phanerochaete carnosa HHB-10118-sp]
GELVGPMLVYLRWEKECDDDFWLTKLQETLDSILRLATRLGLTPAVPAYYSNLSMETMPADFIYRDNMQWLRGVKGKYDPNDVMGRCGGHKI